MVAQGAIVRVEYDAFADGELFDTTSAGTAKKHDLFNEKAQYGPVPLVVGAGRVPPGFDKALERAKVGAREVAEFGPEEGFGQRDPAKVQTFKRTEFEKRDVDPHPGLRIRFENKSGTVTTVSAGRVRVDFNPPMAGKKIRYEFTVTEELAKPEEKALAIVELAYGSAKGEDFKVSVAGAEAEIVLPDRCKYDARWHAAKFLVVADLRRYAGVEKVRFVEEYAEEKPPEPERVLTPEEGGPETAEGEAKPE